MKIYKKADLEKVVMAQLENLDAIHDLLRIMKIQNELLHKANKKLEEDLSEFKGKLLSYSERKKKSN